MAKAMQTAMTHKQPSLTLSTLWSETRAFSAPWRRIGAKLVSLVKVPFGYQDETGFHYGQEPALNKNQSPST
jgi:hypothetical protein